MRASRTAAMLAAAVITAAVLPSTAMSGEKIDMDYNGDGVVDAFDMVNARKTASAAELKRLSDYLLGVKGGSEYKLVWSDEFGGDTLDADK